MTSEARHHVKVQGRISLPSPQALLFQHIIFQAMAAHRASSLAQTALPMGGNYSCCAAPPPQARQAFEELD